MKRALLRLLRLYQQWISPAFPRRCKYEPTCSRYAAEAIGELGVVRGSILAAWRLLRCNPLSNGGIDDVADRRIFKESRRDCSEAHPHAASLVRARERASV